MMGRWMDGAVPGSVVGVVHINLDGKGRVGEGIAMLSLLTSILGWCVCASCCIWR